MRGPSSQRRRCGSERIPTNSSPFCEASAGRIALKLLGLTRAAVFPQHRPVDEERQRVILAVVDALLWRDAYVTIEETDEVLQFGMTMAAACAEAPRYLANPALRARAKIGGGSLVILGQGKPPKEMSPEAVRNAYRKARNAALDWYFEPLDEEE